MPNVDPRFKFAYLVSLKKAEAIFLLWIAAFVTAIGFFLGDSSNPNYEMITAFASNNMWGLMFVLYGVLKFLEYWDHLDFKIKLINSIVGLWMWNYIFLSFTVFDKSNVAPTELMLLMPIIAEMWVLLSYSNKKEKDD